jgi:hypothetical protein
MVLRMRENGIKKCGGCSWGIVQKRWKDGLEEDREKEQEWSWEIVRLRMFLRKTKRRLKNVFEKDRDKEKECLEEDREKY